MAARRDEIIAALAGTAKPYFGDVTTMTYEQWLRRYAELAVGERDTAADWADITWEQRFTGCCSAPRHACTTPTPAKS